ncbi:MAG: HEAT repeat domain-containing protein [Planctomycetota bacterium]|jgi:HEAT repeat protein
MKLRAWSKKRIALLAVAVLLAAAAFYLAPEIRLQLLIHALGSDDPERVGRAIQKLSDNPERRVMESLLTVIDSDEGYSRRSLNARGVFAVIGEPAIEFLLRESCRKEDNSGSWIERDWKRLFGPHYDPLSASSVLRDVVVNNLRERAIEPLRQFLYDDNPDIRFEAIRHMPNIPETAPVLLPLLDDVDASIRLAVLEEIRITSPGDAAPAVIPLLKDGDPAVRRTAAEILGRTRNAIVVAPLTAAAKDENAEVRAAAARALGWTCSREAGDALLGPLDSADEPESVRNAAIWALSRIRDERAAGPFLEALNDEDPYVRRAAAEGLGVLRVAQAAEPLRNLLASEDLTLRREAAGALGRLKDKASVEALIALLAKPPVDEKEKREHDEMMAILRGAMDEGADKGGQRDLMAQILAAPAPLGDEHYVRAAAAEALGRIGDIRAFEPLLAMAQDESDTARAAAIEALGCLGDGRAFETFLQIAAVPEDRGNDTFFEVMARSDGLRVRAVRALGQLGDPRAVSVLERIVREERVTEPEEMLAVTGYPDWARKYMLEYLEGGQLEIEGLTVGDIKQARERLEAEKKSLYYRANSVVLKAALSLEILAGEDARPLVDEAILHADLAAMARDYRSLIASFDPDFLALQDFVLERHGDPRMAEDIYWAGTIMHRYSAEQWAARHGVLDELEASKDTLDRPRLGRPLGE